jgi:benzoate-CoA ligase
MRHEAVLEAAVVGKDCGGLTRTLAYVVLKSGTGDGALADSLKAFVKGQLAPHKYPREIRFMRSCLRPPPGRSSASSCAKPQAGDGEQMTQSVSLAQ